MLKGHDREFYNTKDIKTRAKQKGVTQAEAPNISMVKEEPVDIYVSGDRTRGQDHGEGKIGRCYINGVSTSVANGGEGGTGRCLY